MKELPGDVFVAGQLLAAQMQALAEQGVMSFINNRPDMEGPMQPLSEELEKTCLLYTSPSPRDRQKSRMPSSA